MLMLEVVWGGYQLQTWHYDINPFSKVTQNSQIWGQFGQYNGIRVHPYALETAYQWLKHFGYVSYGFIKWCEVDISLKHDVMASFSLHKWSRIPNSGDNLVSGLV